MDSGTHLVKWMDFLRYPSGRKSSCRQRCGWRGGGGDGALAAARPRQRDKKRAARIGARLGKLVFGFSDGSHLFRLQILKIRTRNEAIRMMAAMAKRFPPSRE